MPITGGGNSNNSISNDYVSKLIASVKRFDKMEIIGGKVLEEIKLPTKVEVSLHDRIINPQGIRAEVIVKVAQSTSTN